VEARGRFASKPNMTAGNENRRWHGTRRECSLGDPGITAFCHYSTCSLCSIIRSSFDLNLFGNRKSGKKCGWGRYVQESTLISPAEINMMFLWQIRTRDLYIFHIIKVGFPHLHRAITKFNWDPGQMTIPRIPYHLR
jgi:hypothetical protein